VGQGWPSIIHCEIKAIIVDVDPETAHFASSLLWMLVIEGIEIHDMCRLAASPQQVCVGLMEQEETEVSP
jgi:hypothetical protein